MEKMLEVLPGTKGAGFVRLVDHCGNDLSIVRAARVSYDADWRTGEDAGKDEKLIKYLWKNKHTSPFESVSFTFEVKAPIFVFRQWHRHRTWSYNEISARYTELDEGFYVPDPDKLGTQAKGNKQMRDINDLSDDEYNFNVSSIEMIGEHFKDSFDLYQTLINRSVPRELARSVLPVAAYSRMFATVDLHNLFHFLRLRMHEHSQYEIRVYALAIANLIRPIVPFAHGAFLEDLDNLYKAQQLLAESEKKEIELSKTL
jgi:thymidylate synthase (FAD)